MQNIDNNNPLDEKSICFLKAIYEYKDKAFPFISTGSMSRCPVFDTPSSPDVNIILRAEQGFCEMTFPYPADTLQDFFKKQHMLKDCMSVVSTGETSVVRILVNRFSFDKTFCQCKSDVDKAFFAIQCLYSLLNLRTNAEKVYEDPLIVSTRKEILLSCDQISSSSIRFGIRRDGRPISFIIMSESEQALFRVFLETLHARLSGFPLPDCTSAEKWIDREDYENYVFQLDRIKKLTLDDLLAIEGMHVDKACLFNDMKGKKIIIERG